MDLNNQDFSQFYLFYDYYSRKVIEKFVYVQFKENHLLSIFETHTFETWNCSASWEIQSLFLQKTIFQKRYRNSLNVYTITDWKQHMPLNFFHFLDKMHLFTTELIFISSNWRVCMRIKFDILKETLEWYKKNSLFAEWAKRNNSVWLAATFWNEKKMKWKWK